MRRILTGIQSSGTPHLGNVLGAILPAIKMSQEEGTQSLFFIADFHALTTVKDGTTLQKNILHTAATWLAFGFDTETHLLYRQSDLPQVMELCWHLSCLTPYPMLANAHSFKDKKEQLHNVNAGLFFYPVLMAADILLYRANEVPVGKDQQQHLEITRDLGQAFNTKYGETLVIPEAKINASTGIVPGTDGRKMSKSYGNFINIFGSEKEIKQQVFGIQTDSTPLEAPKDPETCNVFQILKHVAPPSLSEGIHKKYREGGYGYGHAKKDLLGAILSTYQKERDRFDEYLETPEMVFQTLKKGAAKAKGIADKTLEEVRQRTGLTFH